MHRLAVLLVLPALAAGCSGPKAREKQPPVVPPAKNDAPEPEFRIPAPKLLEEFSMDAPNANEKYKGRILEIVGTVHETRTGSVVLSEDGTGMFIHCYFEVLPHGLEKGQTAVVLGKCAGGRIGAGYTVDVNLINARVVSPE